MTPLGEGSKLLHQAFLYGSTNEFVRSMGPFAREGLARGDTVFAATKRSNIVALREELGHDGELVEFHDTSEWQTRPYGRLQAFKRLVETLPPGGVLHSMGEPVWEGSGAVVRQWARYESIINAALADAPMRFVCLYDSAALPDSILDYAVRTHPERVEHGTRVPSRGFVPPEEFLPGRPAVPPETVRELPLQSPHFRGIVAEQARRAGLPAARIDDFVLAVHEVTTNAQMHGHPPVRATVWAEDGELICQVADAGPGISDPLAGWLPPTLQGNGGWGLALARQLCDAVEIARDGETIVSLHMSLRS